MYKEQIILTITFISVVVERKICITAYCTCVHYNIPNVVLRLCLNNCYIGIHIKLVYATDAHRLNHFTLSVGDSPDKTTECAEYVGSVGSGESVNVSCSAVGRYLKFRREGDSADVVVLCEVVIIGRRHICK